MKKLLALFSISTISLTVSSNVISCQQHYTRDLDGFKLPNKLNWKIKKDDPNNGKYKNILDFIGWQIHIYTNIDFWNTIMLDKYLLFSVTSPKPNSITFNKGSDDHLTETAKEGQYNGTISLDPNDKVFILNKPEIDFTFNLTIKYI